MRVLLLHEMSGVHTELRAGLRSLGVDVDIATYGDGWKKYKSDIFLGRTSGRFSIAGRLWRQLLNARDFRGCDVIQVISPSPFSWPLSGFLEQYVLGGGARVVYVAAGSDAVYRKHVRSLPYYPPHDWYDCPEEFERFSGLLGFVDKVIPVCYEYKYAMEKDGRACEDIIPFPIDISKHDFNLAGRNKKIRFFHPLNRDNFDRFDFKGTKIIREAFSELQLKYSDVAEFLMVGGLPHDEYSRLTDSVDVVVDQLYSMSYGMSAAYGLAKGKVVISGLEDIAKNGCYYSSCPVINAKPLKQDLIQIIEDLILNRHKIHVISAESRSYAESYHDHRVVAESYMGLYV